MKCKLIDICSKIGSGATPKGGKEAYYDQGISLVRSQNVLDFAFSSEGLAFINDKQAAKLSNVEVFDGDVLLNITGDSVARACIMDPTFLPARVNQHVAIIRGKKDRVLNRYLLYFLQLRKRYLLQLASAGATRKALTKGIIEQLEIDLPSLADQKKISALLGGIDDKIELNNRINESLESLVCVLFEHWFMSLNEKTLPNGWHQGTLAEIISITNGKKTNIKQSFCTAKIKIPVVGASSVIGYTNEFLYNQPILVTGRVGTHGVVQRFRSPCWPSDNTLVIKSEFYEYAYQALKRVDYSKLNRGSTQPLITQTDLKNTKILIPPKDVILEFEKLARVMMFKYEANCEENERLAELRDTLLPKLMSGEIDVSQIDL